jgi:PAS domain S-box-containing protein
MPSQNAEPASSKGLIRISAAVFILIPACLLAQRSYLIFHSLAELFAVVVAWGVFVLAFNSRRFIKNSYFIFLGTGLFFVGIIGLFHTLAYKGIALFPGNSDGNIATQLWIAMRYLLGFSFLFAPLFIRKKPRLLPFFTGFSIAATVLLLAILWRPVFPVCIIPGTGLTPFKKISEYIVCAILITSLWLLNRNRAEFHADVFRLLCWSILLIMASELAFTFYIDPSGLVNAIGHLLMIPAFLATYKAVIEIGMNHPNDLVFYDLKRHEAALQAREKEFHTLFEFSGVGMAQVDPAIGRFKRVNWKFCEITGYEAKELKEAAYETIICPEEENGNDPETGKHKPASSHIGKRKYLHKNGSVIWVEETRTTISDLNGGPAYMLIAIQDVTKRQLAETALCESEERYRSLFNALNEGFSLHEIICDDRGAPCSCRFLDINPAFEQMTGLKRKDVIGRPCKEIFPGVDPARIDDLSAVALTGKPIRFENYSPALGRHYDVFAYRPGPRQFAMIFLDTTEAKKLRNEIDHLASFPILNCNPVIEADMEGHIRFANPAARRLLPDIEQLGKNHYWLTDWDDTVCTCRTKQETAVIEREVSENGRHFSLLIHFVPSVQCIRIYGMDITTRKQIEQEAQDLAEKVLEEKDRLLALINSTPDEIWFASADGTFTLMNSAANRTFELDGKSGINVKKLAEASEVYRTNGTLRPVEEAPPLRALSGEFVRGAEEIIRLPGSGELQHRQINSSPVYRDGHIIGSVSVVRDITDAKNTERALRKSESRLKAALLAGKAFTFEWNPEVDAVYRSKNCADILGLDPENCTRDDGRNYFDHIHPEDRDGVIKLLLNLVPAAPDYKTEYRYVRPDGQIVWLEERGQAEFDEKENITRLYGITADITARVEALRRETESVALVSANRAALDMMNAMHEGVVHLQLDGTILNANPAALTMTGLRHQDVAGRNIADILPHVLDDRYLGLARKALAAFAQKQILQIPLVMLKRPPGSVCYISPSIVFIESPQSLTETAVLTLKDITELHENTEMLERIFNNNHLSIAYLDPQFNFIRVNRTYAAACGKPVDFFPGKNHFSLFPHEENERIFRQVVIGGNPHTAYDMPFEFPDHPEWGVTYWNWSLQPVKDAQNRVEALVFCLQDTTSRKTAQIALEKNERKYRELVENSNSIIMRITPEHRITFFNEYAQTFFGYSEKEVIGRSVLETITPPVDSAGNDLRKMTENITAHPEIYTINENENVCKNGQRVWISWTNKIVRDEQGNAKEILCIGTDATTRKRIQDENQHYQERLRRLAEQLAASEEEERWQISRYIHDTIIQNLSLSSMKLGALQSPLTGDDPNQHAVNLQTTRQLIDEAIAECRTVMSELTPPLLYELGLTSALIELANNIRERHGIPVTIEKTGEFDRLDNTLRGLLFQSARELVMNALKHAECLSICISVIQNGNEVQICVRDDGRGFDPALVFTHREAGHGGFGLFSVRERVENLGGRLEIQPGPGGGTEARIFMPILNGSEKTAKPCAAQTNSGA